MKINQISKEKIKIINSVNYHGDTIFYNAIPIIEIHEKFYKGDVFHFEVVYQKMSMNEVYNLMDYLGYFYQLEVNKNSIMTKKLTTLENKYSELDKMFNLIINSRGWQLLEKLRKVKSFWKR